MRVEGGEPERNRAHATELIDEAAAKGANVALLPECCDVGWTDPNTRELATAVPDGESFQALSEAARRNGIYVCAGVVERAGDCVYNSAVLIDSKGDLLHLHRKLNELDIGHPYYDQGDRLGTVETAFGRVGVMICADAFARGEIIARTLGYQGADVVLSPCAWAVPPRHDNHENPYGGTWTGCYGRVAGDFELWIAGVSNVGGIIGGPWEGHSCIGCSMVVDDTGEQVVMLPYGEDAETVEVVRLKPKERPARGTGWGEVIGKKVGERKKREKAKKETITNTE
jgi:predicted amidohydrolase